MTLTERITAYQRFNETVHLTGRSSIGIRYLTPRQWRRVQHKRNHAMAPFGPMPARER